MSVENRDKIVIENVSKIMNKNTNMTYSEAVTCKDKRVSFKENMKLQNNNKNTQ
jgi:hypothetical protein